jgi:hypothetical protein
MNPPSKGGSPVSFTYHVVDGLVIPASPTQTPVAVTYNKDRIKEKRH